MSKKKQAFYENHSGGSITEINTITGIILLGHVSYLGCQRAGLVKSAGDQFAWGFVCYVLNVLLGVTVYSNRHYLVLIQYSLLTIGTSMIAYMYPVATYEGKASDEKLDKPSERNLNKALHTSRAKDKQNVKRKLPFLSVFRATMMITTLIAILAVDLPFFPRRYAKSETWGTSLMDLGVGSFVFSSGMVSVNLKTGFLGGLRQAGILGLMGIGRAIMVRGTGYHEHTSEYGAHWNFFITLSLLPPLLPLFRFFQKRGTYYLTQAFVLLGAYQVLLVKTGWQVWIISAPRHTIISANKEGISSFVGYVAIYLFGMDTGSLILSQKSRPILPLLLISSTLFWSGYLFSTLYLHIRVSRRIANAPYILWVAAHNTSFLFALAFIEDVHRRLVKGTVSRSPKLLEKVNSRGLYVFLGSNLLTGAINLAMGDAMMSANTTIGLSIMLTYLVMVCSVSFIV